MKNILTKLSIKKIIANKYEMIDKTLQVTDVAITVFSILIINKSTERRINNNENILETCGPIQIVFVEKISVRPQKIINS